MLENENRVLKEHLATALRLLHDQKLQAEMEVRISDEMKEFVDSGLSPRESEHDETEI